MKNVGNLDKVIRFLLAAVFVYLFYAGVVTGWLGYLLLGLAGIFVVTSLMGTCPIYSVLGIRTCPAPKQ